MIALQDVNFVKLADFLSTNIPRGGIEHVKLIYLLTNWLRNPFNIGDIEDVIEILEEANILRSKAYVYKGPVMAKQVTIYYLK